jgi:uncharacterized membrane protein YqaE (UPF0057 family)
MSNNIKPEQWTLFDKVMFGGLGYSSYCMPTDFFKVIVAIIFPPLGEVINIVEDTVSDSFPWITWDSLKALFTYKSLNIIVYSFLLTTLFYVPGLVYTLTNIVNKQRNINYEVAPQSSITTTDEYGNAATISVTTINGTVYVTQTSVNGTITLYQKSASAMSPVEKTAIANISSGGMSSVNTLNVLNKINSGNITSGSSTAGDKIEGGFEEIGGLF